MSFPLPGVAWVQDCCCGQRGGGLQQHSGSQDCVWDPSGQEKKAWGNEGPTGASKWDVASSENLALFKSREDEKAEKEAKKKEADEKKKEREEEREAKKKEKEEQIEQKKRQREEKKTLATAKKEAAAAKKADKAAKKAAEEAKKAGKEKENKSQLDDPIPGPSNARKSLRQGQRKWELRNVKFYWLIKFIIK